MYLVLYTECVKKKQSPSEVSITQPKNLNFYFKFSEFVEEIFWHKNTQFHMKIIMRSKVTKVLVKSLKNASEQRMLYVYATLRASTLRPNEGFSQMKSCFTLIH